MCSVKYRGRGRGQGGGEGTHNSGKIVVMIGVKYIKELLTLLPILGSVVLSVLFYLTVALVSS